MKVSPLKGKPSARKGVRNRRARSMSHVHHINREEGIRPKTGEVFRHGENKRVTLPGPNNTKVYYNDVQVENPCIICGEPSVVHINSETFYCAECGLKRQQERRK